MGKHLTLLQYRGGSTLYGNLLRSPSYLKNNWDESFKKIGFSEVRAFPVINASEFPVEVDGKINAFAIAEKFSIKNIDWRIYHGDWWGQCNSSKIPGPYEDKSVMSWSIDSLSPIIKKSWKVLAIVRDGRNWIESTRKFKGGIEEKRQKSDPLDYFKYLCRAFRNRARIIVDCQRFWPSCYKIFKMENLVLDPENSLKEIEKFLQVEFDWETLTKNIASCKKEMRGPGKHPHSSFEDKNYFNRYKNWTKEETDFFCREGGIEQRLLGYSLE